MIDNKRAPTIQTKFSRVFKEESDFYSLILNRKISLQSREIVKENPKQTEFLHVDSSIILSSKISKEPILNVRAKMKRNRSYERALSLSISQVNDYERILTLGGASNDELDSSKEQTNIQNFITESTDKERTNLHEDFPNLEARLINCIQGKNERSNSFTCKDNKRAECHSAPRRVSFSTVEIRRYEQILGDHPSVSSGPSLTIGWNYDPNKTEQLELSSELFGIPTEKGYPKALSRDERIRILFDLGYSVDEVKRSVREINKIKEQRNQTQANLQKSPVVEVMIDAKSSFISMLFSKE